MTATITPLRRKAPRYSPGIAAEGWMEIAEAARRVLVFTEGELATSWAAGDLGRLRQLQSVHRDAATVLAQGRKHAGWADANSCADGSIEPGHGAAA